MGKFEKPDMMNWQTTWQVKQRLSWLAGMLLLLVHGLASSALAQPSASTPTAQTAASEKSAPSTSLLLGEVKGNSGSEPLPFIDTAVTPAGCSSCGGGLLGTPSGGVDPYFPSGCGTPCTSCGGCYAGRRKCCPCEADTTLGRFLCGIYECICCNDPCYEPCWIPVANAAYFVDSARPVSQMYFRYDHGNLMTFPDRSEYFMPRADGKGTGPSPTPVVPGGNPAPAPAGPMPLAETGLNFDELWMHTEAGTGRFSMIMDMSYRQIDPQVLNHASGFGDMIIGTKSLLFDCELIQIAYEFKTYMPTGNFLKGLGTGHVSLEESLLLTVKLTPDTYFQGQLSEWIPIGSANQGYAGSILHYHTSLNHTLCKPQPDVSLIGTLELNGWSFQAGQYTDPVLGPNQKSSGDTYLSMGPGLRFVVCNRIDFGMGTAYSLTHARWADQFYRTEFRIRY